MTEYKKANALGVAFLLIALCAMFCGTTPVLAQAASYTNVNLPVPLTNGGSFYNPTSVNCLSAFCASNSPDGSAACKAQAAIGDSSSYSTTCPLPQKWGCNGNTCASDATPNSGLCWNSGEPYQCGALRANGGYSCIGTQLCSNYPGTTCTTGYTDPAGHCVPKPADSQIPPNCEALPSASGGVMLGGLGASKGKGMCVAYANKMLASLRLHDMPLTYQPPRGPWLSLRLTYNHLDNAQPATPNYFNFGPQWTAQFLSFVQDDPTSGQQGKNVLRYISGGGSVNYNYEAGTFNTSTGAWVGEVAGVATGGVLKRVPVSGTVTSYTFTLPDGTVQTYAKFDGASTYPRRIFLSSITDPQGNTLTLNYDGTLRLTSMTDASGRSTTFSYTNANPKLVTQITDPYGRHADFAYDGSGRLSSITDAVGILSSFVWDDASGGDPTFMKTLTTPYGSTNFIGGRDYTANTRWLEITDPMGQTERLEYLPAGAPGIAATETSFPTGMNVENGQNDKTNTFYWDKHVYPLYGTGAGRDYTKAEVIHWASGQKGFASAIPSSVKLPLENRVYFNYPGQTTTARFVGTFGMAAATGRLLDGGTTSSVEKATYNVAGNPLTRTDAMTRVTNFTYASNNIDLLTIKQSTTVIGTYASYNSQHLPQTYTDAAGKIWSTAYNTAGQVIYKTNPLNETRFWEYDSAGRITRVTIPTSVAFASVVYGTTNTSVPTAASYTYDSYDRVRTKTDSEGYVLTYDYDALDHVTRITYPDATHDDYDYTFQSGPNVGQQSLDPRKYTDRLGRITTYDYDANRNRTTVTEPIDASTTRATNYSYYETGAFKDLTDAKSNVTHFDIDIENRATAKTYAYGTADAKTETTAYENTTSRVKSLTDALAQVKTYSYALDGRVTAIAYTNSVNATPNVSFTYDGTYPRMATMTDTTGTTTFNYVPVGTACNPPTTTTNCGALRLATIDNPSFPHAKITNTFDALGRLSARTIDGGNESYTYDILGRLSTHVTALGTFTYGYLGQTKQLTSRSLSGTSISTAWSYDTNANDRRLTTITNSGGTRSYGLSYVIAGGGGASSPYDVQGITDTAAATHPWATQSHAYTYDDADRVLTANQTTPGNNVYAYDKLGNATTVTNPGSSMINPTYNSMNQIVAWASSAYSYDSNGNTLSGDGIKTYKWDAENRLIEIDYVGTSNKTVFTYDAFNRRATQAETLGGTTTTTRYLWSGGMICQSRTSGDVTIARYHPEGEYIVSGTKKYVYMPDQLDSVRDVVDAATSTTVSALDYSPYGKQTRAWGSVTPFYQYADLVYHPNSGLDLATFRAFDGATGRWINRDPIRERGGINLYGYVEANPISGTDPLGLDVQRCCRKAEILGGLVDHCWLKTGDITAGMASAQQCRADVGDTYEFLYATKVYVSDHSCEKADSCTSIGNVDEQCVNKRLDIGKPLGNFAPYNNCQTFIDEVIAACLIPKPSPPRKPPNIRPPFNPPR